MGGWWGSMVLMMVLSTHHTARARARAVQAASQAMLLCALRSDAALWLSGAWHGMAWLDELLSAEAWQ